ncbi:MAG TPA: hypothetical protein VM639_08730 [Dongiaceae bacterium]|nr:hypothetical protein [Dongiaceae bacterium]
MPLSDVAKEVQTLLAELSLQDASVPVESIIEEWQFHQPGRDVLDLRNALDELERNRLVVAYTDESGTGIAYALRT